MQYYIICFDIQDDKVRAKLSRTLAKYGLRVQGSVFECCFKTVDRKNALQMKLKVILKHSKFEENNIRFYKLNKDTLKHCHDINNQPIAQLPAVVIL